MYTDLTSTPKCLCFKPRIYTTAPLKIVNKLIILLIYLLKIKDNKWEKNKIRIEDELQETTCNSILCFHRSGLIQCSMMCTLVIVYLHVEKILTSDLNLLAGLYGFHVWKSIQTACKSRKQSTRGKPCSLLALITSCWSVDMQLY